MAPQPRFSGSMGRWVVPIAVIIFAVILLIGAQMTNLPRGVAIVTESSDRRLRPRDLGGSQPSLKAPIAMKTAKDLELEEELDVVGGDLGEDDEGMEEDEERGRDQEEDTEADEVKNEDLHAVDDYDEEEEKDKEGIAPSSAPAEQSLLEGSREGESAASEEVNYVNVTALRKPPGPLPKFPPDMPFLEAMATCDTFECLRAAHLQPRAGVRFNYPHLIIIGWQKAATTALYAHLVRHKKVTRPLEKEPEFFTNDCGRYVWNCTAEGVKNYIYNTLNRTEFLAQKGDVATFEASTHYVRAYDTLAADLYTTLPWVKIIIMMREPISRAMSMLIHKKDVSQEGCLTQYSMAHCLLNRSQLAGDNDYPMALNYSTPLQTWLDAFPAGQLLVLQYEELTASDDSNLKYLTQVKDFLGLDPAFPKDTSLPVRNMRKDRLGTEGWNMTRQEYEKIVQHVKNDAAKVSRLVYHYGLGNRTQWLENWQAIWDRNLATCDENDNCSIFVS